MNFNFFSKTIRTIDLLGYSNDKLINLYFDIFFKNSPLSDKKILDNSKAIKELMYKELSTYKITMSFCTVQNDIRKIHSSFGHLTKEWDIDWAWVMHHIILDFCNLKLVQHFIEKLGAENVFVYKSLPVNYTKYAENIYLKDAINREPKVFQLIDLLKNPHGLKDLPFHNMPIIGANLWSGFSNKIWDLTELKFFNKNTYWDNTTKSFEYKYISTGDDKYNAKGTIKVTIGDKTIII